MRMKIYDYENRPVEVELPDKEIKVILVQVLTGDETGYVLFEDGSQLSFDASTTRVTDYDDGPYIVTREYLAEWFNWEPTKDGLSTGIYSYDRKDWYWDRLIKLEDFQSSPECVSGTIS